MLELARRAQLEFCVFRHNAHSPGEDAALARVLYMHIPEFAKRQGETLRDNEGHDPNISVRDESLPRLIAADLSESRWAASWLAAHIKPDTMAMFAKGRDNAFDGMFDRFAEERGFVRDDHFSKEAKEASGSSEQIERKAPKPQISAIAAYAAQRSMG